MKSSFSTNLNAYIMVAPLVGAWIEISVPPTFPCSIPVAPLVGAWIEIQKEVAEKLIEEVAPLVGAWIEILTSAILVLSKTSLPLWERGLK